MLIGQYHQTLMSPIEYLSLESQYHPSWLMRIFFKRLFRSFAKGQSLHELSLKYGCNFSLKEIELSDLNHIIQTLSTNHPVAFPYPLIWKWIVLLIAQYYICESILYSFEYMMFHMILLMFIMRELWLWNSFKIMSLKLYFLKKYPIEHCIYTSEGLIPQVLRNQSDRKLWKQIYTITPVLGDAISKFIAYWSYQQQRSIMLRRNFWMLYAQLLVLGSFIYMIQPIFNQMYGADSWLIV